MSKSYQELAAKREREDRESAAFERKLARDVFIGGVAGMVILVLTLVLYGYLYA